MLNINVLYIYPKIIEVNKEINLFRIIDKNLKETVIVYCERLENEYKIWITNTMHGQIQEVSAVSNLRELDLWMNKFKTLEKNITSIENLSDVEKYILKTYKY